MKKVISANLAGKIVIAFLTFLSIFHLLILLNVLPSEIVWGGRVNEIPINVITLELISLGVTLLFMIIIAAKLDYIKVLKYRKVISVGVWLIFIYFILNTIGNLASSVSIEKYIFAPITMLLCLLIFRIAIEK